VGSLQIDRYRQHSFQNYDVYTIVITTQISYVKQTIIFVTEFLEIARGKLDLCIYIKLHPSELDKGPYMAAFGEDKRVQVLLNSEQPTTLEILARADLHASRDSTCHYESLAMGTPTIVLPFTGYEIMSHLYERGHASLARTPRDMLDIILKLGRHRVPDDVGEQYFKPGALANIKRELGI
jgi:hypothetical protein